MEFSKSDWYHVANFVQKDILDDPDNLKPILDLIEYVINFANLDK